MAKINKKSETKEAIVFKDYDVLRYPVITEKSTKSGESGQYFFVVDKNATKNDIKLAVERIFDVKVKSVNTAIRKGKLKTFRGRTAQLSDKKRAMVRLESGHNIEFVSGV
jgi:large subunit ribosomal protein L23